MKKNGCVYLIGAGPGDPGLITVRGRQLLLSADVVVHDALVDPALLAQLPPGTELIDAGKRAGDHKLSQTQINALLVREAREGKIVVRLKGGDPYLFGRGAEEVTHLAKHGVEAQVVPGVTAAIAAATFAGIPVTHRRLASTITFVTGHEDPTKGKTAINYEALAKLIAGGGTICFYMGVGRIDLISQQLQSFGLSGHTPVAVVQWGTLPKQRSVRTTLAAASVDVSNAGMGPPAIIVVGDVAAIEDPGLDFFTRRPLFGQRVVVTRTRQQVSELRQHLVELGAEVLEAPTIELVEPEDWAPVDDAIQKIQAYDWLVFTSTNGVGAVAERLENMGLDARHLAGVKIAVIGPATAEALASRLGIGADLVPTRFVAETLATELIGRSDVANKRFLLLRADIARPALPVLLAEAGAHVTELTVYRTKLAAPLSEHVLKALRDRAIEWITFTSSSTVKNMVELLGQERDLLKRVKIASIGPVTSATLRELELAPTIEATTSSIPGLVKALTEEVGTQAFARRP